MDRGTVATNVRLNTADVQICHHDLGDEWSVFLTAAQPGGWNDPAPEDPVDMDAPDRTWPEATTVNELDQLIEALQAQRVWLAEQDPDKRERFDPAIHPVNDELSILRMRVGEEMTKNDELGSGLGHAMEALREAAAALEAIARGADPQLADEAAQNARDAAGIAGEYIPDWEG